jgi:hypothetical protein
MWRCSNLQSPIGAESSISRVSAIGLAVVIDRNRARLAGPMLQVGGGVAFEWSAGTGAYLVYKTAVSGANGHRLNNGFTLGGCLLVFDATLKFIEGYSAVPKSALNVVAGAGFTIIRRRRALRRAA